MTNIFAFILLSVVVAPIYIPISSVRGFLFSTPSPALFVDFYLFFN